MTKKTDVTINFPRHDDAEAVRRFEEETGAIQIVVVRDPEIFRVLDGLLNAAVGSCFGPDKFCAEDAYDRLVANIAFLNQEREAKIPLPSLGMFKNRLELAELTVRDPWVRGRPEKPRPPRDPARTQRQRGFWFDACNMFMDMDAAGIPIDGERARLSDRALQIIIPTLHRAVGGEREGMEPPSPRWFRRQVWLLMSHDL